ncbi:MAG: bifunctional 3-demethylubiquinol 3-O-methyltransferase/2-polyprenyl-6-hydroxyphenol methylase [Alphaproteobacteria bacterium]|nr:MAG: bifunctional 3-demethylubiquinol 3-O-methyltransferase/2-polyprenyl-6-hydroxyphenol methylase [Alphaproteobacteria bacterium]
MVIHTHPEHKNQSKKGKTVEKTTTIDPEEIIHFAKDSKKWWDEDGPFKPLHRLNPVRMDYIEQQIASHYDVDFDKLNILDIGCGGGLVSESLAQMGMQVTGIDADANAIEVANAHAKTSELDISYICGDAQDLDKQYDVVVALEIIEHVRNVEEFIEVCINRLKPNGLLIMSTLNRTPKSFALGIVAAEHILRWVPRGTHTWSKFVKPSEIARHARKHNLTPYDVTGLIFNPLKNAFHLSETDLDVNYLISLRGAR